MEHLPARFATRARAAVKRVVTNIGRGCCGDLVAVGSLVSCQNPSHMLLDVTPGKPLVPLN